MRSLIRLLLAPCLLACVTPGASTASSRASNIAAAVGDPTRPASDVARDTDRKPASTLAFSGVKRGDVVADFIANSGYFTRLFADVVGPAGHVYAVELNEIITYPNVAKGYAELKGWAATRPNVTVQTVPAGQAVGFAKKLDVFWISQNYHDLHDTFLGPVDVAAFNRQVFNALKPGGLYIVLDHAAATDAKADVTETLHRIRAETVEREVEAAGFTLEARSPLLTNPNDPRTANVFDKSIAGRTDQFILKFRRPRAG